MAVGALEDLRHVLLVGVDGAGDEARAGGLDVLVERSSQERHWTSEAKWGGTLIQATFGRKASVALGGSLGREADVVEQAGDRHGPDTARHGSDRSSDAERLIEGDVPREPTIR